MDRLRIEDGTIRYHDERSGSRQEIRQLEVLADGLNLTGEPFRVEGRGELLLKGEHHGLRLDSDVSIGTDELGLADTTIALAAAGGRTIEFHAGAGTFRYADGAAALDQVTVSSGSLRGT